MIARLVLAAAVLAVAGFVLAPALAELPGLLAVAGWTAPALLVLVHAVPVALCGMAWAAVAPHAPVAAMVLVRWIRDGFNEMLAVVPLAGEAAALRLLGRRGVKPAPATAGMVADLTAEVVAQILFSLIGLALWAAHASGAGVLRWGLPGVVAAAAVAGAFVAVQRGGGLRLVERLAAHLLPRRRPVAGLHAQLMALYRRPRRLAGGVGLHLLAWLAACAEAWVALRLLGHPISVAEAVMLESAVFALRSAAFMVPGALGLQEGFYAVLGPLLGVPPAVALTLSVLKRAREVIMGVPALLAWLRLGR
ncbi:MAG: lysylphosphatidylglycerol synthase domain-containing protein [Magnetospirillum sp.]|nr:lysylphosphatidylglycerol synthase domain-containing protein [Magnetospirillum sp.]